MNYANRSVSFQLGILLVLDREPPFDIPHPNLARAAATLNARDQWQRGVAGMRQAHPGTRPAYETFHAFHRRAEVRCAHDRTSDCAYRHRVEWWRAMELQPEQPLRQRPANRVDR